MKQRKKGMPNMNDVTRKEGVNELSEDALDAVTGGGYYTVYLSGENGKRTFETLQDAIAWANYTDQKITSQWYNK